MIAHRNLAQRLSMGIVHYPVRNDVSERRFAEVVVWVINGQLAEFRPCTASV